MKKIGREVLFLAAGEGNPRNGEGTFARLKDGRILFAYTYYYGNSWDDSAIARICGCYSSDEGESWTQPVTLLEKDPAADNLMSPSLFTLSDGELGMVYLRKETNDGLRSCIPWFRRSDDCGRTWSEPVRCVQEDRYFCAVNDCACVNNGRIYIPMSCHDHHILDDRHADYEHRRVDMWIACSDDDGKSWHLLNRYSDPFVMPISPAEPGVYVRENGDLWSWFRTGAGHQYQVYSTDGGKTFTSAIPNFFFTSPDSPMRVKKCAQYLIAVFNPLPFSCVTGGREVWKSPKRTPLVCAVSTDDGESFALDGRTPVNGRMETFVENCYLLEEDRSNSYCYPAIQQVEGGFLVHYYHSNNTPACLNSAKIVKVGYNELTDDQ